MEIPKKEGSKEKGIWYVCNLLDRLLMRFSEHRKVLKWILFVMDIMKHKEKADLLLISEMQYVS